MPAPCNAIVHADTESPCHRGTSDSVCRDPVLVRVLSVPVVVLLLLGGGWVAGALITNDFTVSMLLTAAWVAPWALARASCLFSGGARCGRRWRRSRSPRRRPAPTSAAADPDRRQGGRGRRHRAGAPARADEARCAPPPTSCSAAGQFESLEHETTGVAQAIEVRGRPARPHPHALRDGQRPGPARLPLERRRRTRTRRATTSRTSAG